MVARSLYCQATKYYHLYPLQRGEKLAKILQLLMGYLGGEAMLVVVAPKAHHHLVKEAEAALEDVEMAYREGIKTTGKKSSFHK